MDNNPFATAASSAEKLSKSVLGTLALFLLLVYLIASITLSFGKIDEQNQTLLVYFIILFPVLVLGVFYVLVTRHFGKIVDPDKIDKETYAKIVLRTIESSYRDVQRSAEANESAEENRETIIRELGTTQSEPERQILHRIIDWYSPEWRQKRYLFRRASEEFGQDPETLFSDQALIKEIIDVFRFLDYVAVAVNQGAIKESRIPANFKESAVRYYGRGKSWIDYLRQIKKDTSRYERFEMLAKKWESELRSLSKD